MNKKVKQIKPMLCSVCGKIYFSELTDVAIEQLGETPNDVQCRTCGWFYDLEQTNYPNLENQSNKMSLNQYKEWYKKKIKKNKKWEYYLDFVPKSKSHKCPVCKEYTFPDTLSYEICPICGWQDTGFEKEPDEQPGLYMISFNEKKSWLKKQREKDPNFKWFNAENK